MKNIKNIWKVLRIVAKIATFLITNQSWRDLIADIKATWQN